MIPKRRFPEFNESWHKVSISEIAEICGGGTPDTTIPEYWGNEINWFTPTEIGKSKFVSDSKRKISHKGLSKSSAKLLPEGTILLSTRATIGETSITTKKSTTNQGFQNLIIRDSYKIEFVYYLLETLRKELLRRSSGSTFLEISKKEISKIKCFLPTFSEQEKIAYLFSSLDQKINLLTKKKEAFETYKKGLMQRIFSQELKFKREDGTHYPDWRSISLKDILKERKSLSSDTESIELVSLTKEGVVAKSERYNREFLVKDVSKKYKLTLLDDICYNPANLKFGVICRNTFGKALFSPIYVTFEVNNNLADNNFIELFVTSQNFIQKSLKFQEGTVYERMAVKPDDLVRSVVPLPCMDEQKRVVSLIGALETKIEILNSSIESMKRLKEGLLQQMFV